ncbi:MAG: hypothetical protein WC444_06075 [Candidatus Paceibacterota bacterium]
MKTLTEEEAHSYCLKAWEWLSKHSDPTLSSEINKYMARTAIGISDDFVMAECFLCEYYCNQYNGGCYSCPINKCNSRNKPYVNWYLVQTPENALIFYNYLKKKLKKEVINQP